MQHPLLAPVFPAGMEPLPPGMTEDDRANMLQVKKYQDYMSAGMESCIGKTAVAGAFGTPILNLSAHCFLSSIRCRCWWLLFLDVLVVCIRGPATTAKLEYHTKNDGNLQGYGSRHVEEREGVWEGRGFVRGD